MSNHDWYYDRWAYNYCRAYKNDNDEYDDPDDYVMEYEEDTEDEEDDLFV